MKNILLIVFFAFSIVSCDKDEPEAENAPAMQNLTGNSEKKWKISFAEAKAGTSSVNLINNYPCFRDNILTLKADGTYTMVDAGVSCSPGSANSTILSGWVLNENPLNIRLGEFQLYFNNKPYTLEDMLLEITSINSNSFSGVVKNVSFQGFAIDTITLTFVEVK